MDTINTGIKLSALWLFILLNIIFRDIHQMTLKSHLEMLLTGYYNGTKVTDTIMLIGAFVVEIPIAMVLFSLLLNRRISRVVNIIAACLTTATLLFTPPSDSDDMFFLIVELIAISAIVWTVIKWREANKSAAVIQQ